MNERIRQLAEQAGFIDRGSNHTAYMSFDHEKFAELIVKECVAICHKMAEDSDSYVVHDGDTCAEQIKEHFGVEESKREKIDKAMRAAFKDGVDLSGKETP